MGEHNWKGDEKVRRTAAKSDDSVPAGTLGTVKCLYDGRCPTVLWEGLGNHITYGYYKDRYPLACLELVESTAAPASAQAQPARPVCHHCGGPHGPLLVCGPRLAAEQQPAASVKVCGSECDTIRGILRNRAEPGETALDTFQRILDRGDQLAVNHSELGDVKGGRDSWRSRAERAERALDLASQRARGKR